MPYRLLPVHRTPAQHRWAPMHPSSGLQALQPTRSVSLEHLSCLAVRRLRRTRLHPRILQIARSEGQTAVGG
ncbi:MAG: hypothetical protein AVDCRST_MAG59-5249 [uncultured Thermomicrobiales bacterium]|uniref:Uncharacterized protein n=1 Tax=uncultured Thermomicrobiales bacterium TaxID=1645740 RepID=A0A6J4VPC3_9BACT|nr:MAG: hypothetical protein AVDCRST_MAG59-5249 [uncultured Thermomicrobiales bacterium]